MADLNQLLSMLKTMPQARLSTPAQPKRPGFDPTMLNDESIDPSVRVDAFNGSMQGELRDRIFQAERSQNPVQDGIRSPNATSPHEVRALKGLLGGFQDERASSPIALQQQEYDMQRQGNTEALNQGFPGGPGQNPMQARELYRREQERTKLNQPVQLEGMRQGGENFRQGRQIDATQRMVETQMEPSKRYNDAMAGYYESLAGGNLDTSNVRKFGRNGIEFQADPKPANTAQFSRDLATARFNLGSAGISDPLADLYGGSPEQQYFTSTLQSYIARSPIDPASKSFLMSVLSDPEDRTLTPQQLAQKYDLDTNDPDWPMFQNLLLEIRNANNPATQSPR
jgi:hypothetical protein